MVKTVELELLHPCSVVTLEILREKSLDSLAIAFTPRDSYSLWAALHKHVTDRALIADVEPSVFFARFGDPARHQVTLEQAKAYESALKAKLELLARQSKASPELEAQLRALLNQYALEEAPPQLTPLQLFSFAMKCKAEGLTPCLCFQLDSFKCLEMFKDLLGLLEQRQAQEFPNYYRELEEKAEAAAKAADAEAKARESMLKGGGKGKGKDDEDGGAASLAADLPQVPPRLHLTSICMLEWNREKKNIL